MKGIKSGVLCGALFVSTGNKNSGHKIYITTEEGTTKANVRVHIRRRIVQIQREDPGIRRIAPITATIESAQRV